MRKTKAIVRNYALSANLASWHSAAMHSEQPTIQTPSTQVIAASPRSRRRRPSSALQLLLGSSLLGTIGVFVVHGHADPLTMTWFRCAFGWIGLTLWLMGRGQISAVYLPRAAVAWTLAAGALLLTAWTLFFAAIPRTSTGMAVVLFQFQPLWILLMGAVWLREPVSQRSWVAVCMAMVGLVLATGVFSSVSNLSEHALRPVQYWIGVFLCLIGSWCTAFVTIIAKRLRGLPAGVLAWWQCAIGAATLWWWPMNHGWPTWGSSWLWLAGLGLVHTGLVYALMYAGIGKLPASRTAVLQFAYPAVAVGIDWAYFGTRMDGMQLLGIFVMAVATLLTGREPAPRPRT